MQIKPAFFSPEFTMPFGIPANPAYCYKCPVAQFRHKPLQPAADGRSRPAGIFKIEYNMEGHPLSL